MPLTFVAGRTTSIFVAYRRGDTKWITGRIFDRLQDHFGKSSVFMDIETTPLGLDFREHIANVLGGCDVVVAVIGPNWNELNAQNQPRIFDPADWVRAEIETALKAKILIIPALIDRAHLPQPSDLPESVRDFTYRQAVDIDSGRNFNVDVKRLINAIEQHVGRRTLFHKCRSFLRRYGLFAALALAAVAAVAFYLLRHMDFESAESKLEKRQFAIHACNVAFTVDCAMAGGAFGSDEALGHLSTCRSNAEIVASDDPSLQWKDIWTTSVYSFAPGGGGPGGGLDDDVLKVGGWGDWYFSLVQFKLPQLQRRPRFAGIVLYSKQSEGASVPLALDRIIRHWDFPKGDRLWWKDRPGHRAVTTDPLPAPKKEQWYVIELTELVQEWLDGKSENFGIQLRPVHEFGSFVFFVSSDATDKSKIPRLIFCS
jgi:TIR domain-containing protein